MELKKEVESLLFSSGKMMNEKELGELTSSSESEVRAALNALKKEYDERDTSLMLVQSGGNWKLNVREKYMNLVTKIVADTELPFPVLETLSIIAYKAPVMQAEVIKTRGTNAYEHISVLVKDEFIEKKKEGRSFKLSLTPKFFKYFDVEGERDIKEALKEVKIPEKVGNLNVVDLPPEEVKKQEEREKNKLGDLEVIDEPEQTGEKEEKLNIENNKPDNDFLKNIDDRIAELGKKNDELDEDELFKRQEELNKEESREESEEEGKDEIVAGKEKEEDEEESEKEEPEEGDEEKESS